MERRFCTQSWSRSGKDRRKNKNSNPVMLENDFNVSGTIPKKIEVLELLLRDGLQHSPRSLPTEAKLYYAQHFIEAGYKMIEVTNFANPKNMTQFNDAETLLQQVHELDIVKEKKPHLKCYGMNIKAFERAANMAQKGFPPSSVAFTISAEDLHGMRNSGRTRREYMTEIPEMIRIARENNFDIDMAIACVYGSPFTGPVAIENTIELMDWGLDEGIRNFTPCDTTGESNPKRSYEYMSALVDRYNRYDHEIKYRTAHFHECRGMSIVNTLFSIMAGADIVESSLGMGGGQPAFLVDDVPGKGTGPLYTNSWEVGNCPTEDCLVMLDEQGIHTGIDIEAILRLGRLFEWNMKQTLPVWTTKSGRPVKYPVEWCLKDSLEFLPPYGPNEIYWAFPGKYEPLLPEHLYKYTDKRLYKPGKCFDND